MFKAIESLAGDAFDVVDSALNSLSEGELPSKYTVRKMFQVGMEVYAIAAVFNVGEDVIRELLNKE